MKCRAHQQSEGRSGLKFHLQSHAQLCFTGENYISLLRLDVTTRITTIKNIHENIQLANQTIVLFQQQQQLVFIKLSVQDTN